MADNRNFIGRTRDLAVLREDLAAPEPAIIFVLGRRRVGKSRLLLEATHGTPTIYFQATRVAPSVSVEQFKGEARTVIEDEPVWAVWGTGSA